MDKPETDEEFSDPANDDGRDPADDDPDDSAHSDDAVPADDPPTDSVGTDIARNALADARVGARGRPRGRGSRESRNRIRRQNLAGRNSGGYSGPGFDPTTDPQRIGGLIGGLVADQGWGTPLAQARVFAEWSQLVGADIAAHASPQTLNDGELRIAAESTAWATQLRLLSSRLLARLVAELGPDVVTRLVITGPTAPSWKHGNRSVRGARGPRDTYG